MNAETFSLVISEFIKKSKTNSGPQIIICLTRTTNATIKNKISIDVNQFLCTQFYTF